MFEYFFLILNKYLFLKFCIKQEFNTLLKPLATCSSFLNDTLILNYFENSIRRIYEFIKAMSDEDFKDKVYKFNILNKFKVY